MKNLILATLMFCSALTANATEIHPAPGANAPIEFQIVRTISRFGILAAMYDTRGRVRLSITRPEYRPFQVKVFNSRGQVINRYAISTNLFSQLVAVFNTATTSCPVAVTVNPNYLTIEDVRPSCSGHN